MEKKWGESFLLFLRFRMIPDIKVIGIVTILIFIYYNLSYSQWNQLDSLGNLGNFPSISIIDANNFFIAGGPNSAPVIYKTTDGGLTFTSLNTSGISLEIYSIWAIDANNIYVGDGGSAGGKGGNAKVYKTTNGGTNWTNILSTGGTNGFINGIVFSRTNPLVGIIQSDPPGGSGKAFWLAKTTNGGINWTTSSPSGVSGNLSAQNSVFIIDENFYGFGLNLSPQMRYTTNGGTNWVTKTLTGAQGASGFVTSIAFNNDKLHGVAAGYGTYNSVSRTTDGGVTWFAQAIPCTLPNGNNFGELKWIPGYNTVYLLVSSDTATESYKSEDNGETWTRIIFNGNGGITHMDGTYSSSFSQLTSVSSSGPVYKLTDSPMPVNMKSFTNFLVNRTVKLIWVTEFEENNAGFQIERHNELKKSGQAEWESIGFVKGSGNSGSMRRYEFIDSKLDFGNYNYRIKQIDYNGNYKYYYLSNLISIPLPAETNLLQNYPNPFNSVTRIEYELPAAADVKIILYDINGREILKMVNGMQPAGYNTFQFNGSQLSSGIYFYKLISNLNGNQFILIRKMSIIK